jgi:hypothetical protein
LKISFSTKFIYSLAVLLLAGCLSSYSQIHRIGGGLTFSSGADFNYGETGNPGIVLKTWLALNKASTMHIVPSVTAYNRYKFETGYSILTNLMFQGDLNFQYTIFHEGTVAAVAFGGANVTYLHSDFEPLIVTGNETITDASDLVMGANLGAGLELRMAPKWDFNITGKYLFSNYSQFIISVQGVYYFKSRRRSYGR